MLTIKNQSHAVKSRVLQANLRQAVCSGLYCGFWVLFVPDESALMRGTVSSTLQSTSGYMANPPKFGSNIKSTDRAQLQRCHSQWVKHNGYVTVCQSQWKVPQDGKVQWCAIHKKFDLHQHHLPKMGKKSRQWSADPILICCGTF